MKQNCKSVKIALLFLLFPIIAFAQSEITGAVQDANGVPIPFANVIEKGTSNGVTTDFDGKFIITVDNLPTTLEFSLLGFATLEQEITSTSPLQITLSESAESLDEVIITGLASSVKRSNLANAVSSVSAEDLVGTTGQTTVDGALYGKVTGVNITASSGAPGGGLALRLRGVSSINGNNQPLIIIDGVYVNNVEIPSGLRFASGANRGNEENAGNRLADIDPNDIENIEILKGSSAAAIYGQRGNAGVVIITTKRGKGGKTKINFKQDLGFTRIANPLGLRPWTAESVLATFGQDELDRFNATIASNGELFDYEDEIYGETGFITETALSATGGNEKTKFYIGGSYRDEEGIIKNTGFNRLSLRTNIDHKISDVFDVTSTTNYIRSNSSRSFTGNENEGGLSYGYSLAFTRPWNNLFPDENGNYPLNPNYPGNPLFVRDQAQNEDSNNRIIQGLSLTSKIFTNDKNRVKFVLNGGVDYLANETFVYVPETHQGQLGNEAPGFVAQGKNNFTQFNYQAIAVWNHDALNGDLALTSQAGITYLNQEANVLNARGFGLAAGQTNLEQTSVQATSQFLREEEDFGYFTQVEGNYKNKIIGTLGYRLDKSSRNGDPNRLYGFPKASVAVNIAIAGLKGDPDVEPETAKEFEIGFDVGFLNSRINLEATYYNKNVDDLLLQRQLPASSGFTTELTNLADLRNQGVELAINADLFQSNTFKWNTGIQFYLNRSEVTRLDVPAFAQPGAGFGLGLGTFFIEEGSPVTQIVTNIDGVPTQVGNVEPDFQMAFNNNITLLENFDISFLLQLKAGGDNLNLTRFLTDLGQTSDDLETAAGQARLETPANGIRFVEPAGYLRLREAAIYYRIPTSTIEKAFGETVGNIKIGISGRNIFTITDYSSYDPEVSVNGGAGLSSGIEVTPFPSSRQFYFHLNVNF